MPRRELESLLEELRNELDQSDQLDEATRSELNRLQERIARRLEQSSEDDESSLAESIGRFEEKHPGLTMTLGRIADILNKLGI